MAEAVEKNAQGVFPEEGVWRAERARIPDQRSGGAKPGTEAGLARRDKPATRRRESPELNLIRRQKPSPQLLEFQDPLWLIPQAGVCIVEAHSRARVSGGPSDSDDRS